MDYIPRLRAGSARTHFPQEADHAFEKDRIQRFSSLFFRRYGGGSESSH
jgi:hypothetical protein